MVKCGLLLAVTFGLKKIEDAGVGIIESGHVLTLP
jgi:hypothetical protein